MRQYIDIRMMILVLLLFVAGQGSARIYTVRTTSEINKTWQAGDTLVIPVGTYTNLNLTIKGTGSSKKPIVLKAQHAGKTIMTGQSRLTISGAYIEASGLLFTGDYKGSTAILEFASSSHHCRMTEMSIESYNTSDKTKDYKWVSLHGHHNRVDYCHFENKTNAGTLLVVWLESGVEACHQIDHNRFYRRTPNLDENGKEINAQEIIRIGDSKTSMQYASCVVESNLFEECNGEMEIISNKSCGNIYRNNTFMSCVGTLTLRHGNDCLVDGNFFFGNGVKNTGGVRIIGEDHTVINNYFEDLMGNNYRAGLCIVRGKKDSELNEYFQVKNAEVSNNTFVNCKEAFCVNYHSSSDCTLPPLNTIIENNHVYNTSTSNRNIYLAETASGVTWRNNIMNKGAYKNISISSPAVIKGEDAKMFLSNTNIPIYEPQSGSALVNYTTVLPAEVVTDVMGRERPKQKLPGCSEIEGEPTRIIPDATTTGPRWKRGIDDTHTGGIELPHVVQATKQIVQGQVVIERNGVVYTPSGQVINTAN